MKIDTQVIKRLDELNQKALFLEATREKTDFGSSINSELFFEWGTSCLNILARVFGESSEHYRNFRIHFDAFNGWATQYESCRGILRAAKDDYENGYLLNVKTLISAEVIDNYLDQSIHLLENKYKDPACVIIGVSLETALKDLCLRNNLGVGKLDKMNSDLYKQGVYNVGMHKQITAWADRRNNAAHGNWNQYSEEDVKDMLKGVSRFIAEYM